MPDPLLTASDMEQAWRLRGLPTWVRRAYEEFRAKVEDDAFPCTFGIVAHRKGDLCYAYIDSESQAGAREKLAAAVAAFAGQARAMPAVSAAMTALTVFMRPGPAAWTLSDYFQHSWALLQYLHEHDPQPWPARVPRHPDNPAWSFCFAGLPLFINFHTPAHRRRRSRAMQAAFTLLIQPREGFDVIAGDHPKGRHARQLIRQKLQAYDGVPGHPVLGHYGAGDNREWKQYFLPDGAGDLAAHCPFRPQGGPA